MIWIYTDEDDDGDVSTEKEEESGEMDDVDGLLLGVDLIFTARRVRLRIEIGSEDFQQKGEMSAQAEGGVTSRVTDQ